VCILFPKCRRRLICAASHASISESEREREREREREGGEERGRDPGRVI